MASIIPETATLAQDNGFAPEKEGSCPQCGLPYEGGRFGWGGGTPGGHAERCPACGQVHDEFPGGALVLSGAGFAERRKKVLDWMAAMVKTLDKDHPGKLVESIEPRGGEVVIRTSEALVARRLGDALCKAFGGSLEYRYLDPATVLNVEWTL